MVTFLNYIYRVPGYDPRALARRFRYRGYPTLAPVERGQYCSVLGPNCKLMLFRNEIAFVGRIASCWAMIAEVGGVESPNVVSPSQEVTL